MKIYRYGNNTKYWWENQKFRCVKCECVFELELSDASNIKSNNSQIQVNCPTCKSELKASKPLLSGAESIFDEVFGSGGIFERVFGKAR